MGNCVQTCLASVLSLPMNSVPAFDEVGGPEQIMAVDNWLRARGIESFRRYTERGQVPFNEGIYLATGPTIRGTTHMVVMCDGRLLHDPHPSQSGLLEVRYTTVLIPHDPGIIPGPGIIPDPVAILPPRRRPHIGDAVVFILLRNGTRRQFPALVTDGRLEYKTESLYPAVSLCWVNMDTPYVPPTWWGRLLARMGYNFGYGPALEQRIEVQHRDNWGAEQGGDDFGEHWCWPDESVRAQTYLD